MKTNIRIRARFASLGSTCVIFFLSLASIQIAGAQTNTKTGIGAGAKLTTGKNNTADGFRALFATKTGSFNTAVGGSALTANLGSSNVALGYQALFKNTKGSFNVALGDGALRENRNGKGNIGIGEDGGFNITGDNNICIGNKGISGQSGVIRIGTPGTHNATFIAGTITGNGSGLTGVTVPASNITGSFPGGQITGGSISTTQIAPAAVNSSKLASNLSLSGTTSGTFSGNLTGNATTATNAGGLLGAAFKLSTTAFGSFGQTTSFEFDGSRTGLLLESQIGSNVTDSAGIFLNGNVAVIYSPGDGGNVLSVFDEDNMADDTLVAGFRVLNNNAGISTPGTATASEFIGSGASLTNLNAATITSGTIPDARLSSNVALKNADVSFSSDVTLGGDVICSSSGTEGIQWKTGAALNAHIFRFNSDSRLYFSNNGLGNLTGLYLASGATSFTSTSDERLKTDVEPVSGILAKIKDIRVVGFNMADMSSDPETGKTSVHFNQPPRVTNDGRTIKHQIGTIAQDWIADFPEIVTEPETEDGYYGVSYDRIGVVALGAAKELNEIIAQQAATIAALEKRLEALENAK